MKRLLCILCLPVVSVLGDDGSWTANEAMLLYFDAVSKIHQQALVSNEYAAIITDSLTHYVKTLDPHSRFFSADAYARWKEHQSSRYAGAGMELATDREGSIACFPYPGSPAALAGIRDGDRLMAVDGVTLEQMDVFSVGMRVRGLPGSAVTLHVKDAAGIDRAVEMVRRQMHAPSVVVEAGEGMHRIRIYRFTTSTATELAEVVARAQASVPVVIDLRGNPGGSLYDAIDAAALFLNQGAMIASIRTREQTRTHRAERPPPFPDREVWLLQDERTASSAELFIAALTGNARARSLGARTAGKGTTQSMIELVDGAALLLTVGELLTPKAKGFHDVGLAPSLSLNFDPDHLDDQLRNATRRPFTAP